MARAKKNVKAEIDNSEFFEALRLMEEERGIPQKFIAEKFAEAIVVAARKDFGGNDIVSCTIDPENKIFSVVARKEIAEKEEYKWKNFFGLDYGYTNDPTAFIAFRANPIDKEIYIFKEFYKKRMLNSQIAEEIIRLGFSKERIRADSAEPKSNDDLRRLGISRITPSVKGRDSILNGISKICEYKIFISPECVNTIREFSTYVYEDRCNDKGQRMPKDTDNHLCDALRYAFEDVKFFKPQKRRSNTRKTLKKICHKRRENFLQQSFKAC